MALTVPLHHLNEGSIHGRRVFGFPGGGKGLFGGSGKLEIVLYLFPAIYSAYIPYKVEKNEISPKNTMT